METVSYPSVLPPSNQLDTSFVSRTVVSSLFGTGSSCKDKGEFGENGEFARFVEELGIKYDEIPSFDNITFIEDEGGFETTEVDQGEFGDNGEFAKFAEELGVNYNDIPSFGEIDFVDVE